MSHLEKFREWASTGTDREKEAAKAGWRLGMEQGKSQAFLRRWGEGYWRGRLDSIANEEAMIEEIERLKAELHEANTAHRSN